MSKKKSSLIHTLPPKLVLTDANYYTRDNQYITNSKISDFLKDPQYFFQKHVAGILENNKSEALIIGGAVDCLLTEGWDAFKKRYVPVARRNLKEPPTDHIELTQNQYDDIVKMGERIMAQSAFKELAGYQTQKILQFDMPLGNFFGIAGKPDWFKIENGTGYIRDLKTSSTIAPGKYFFHCLRYGYFRQQAMYQLLLEKIHGVKKFLSQHFTMEKDPDGIFTCQTFTLDQSIIEMEKKNILTILDVMAEEKDFKAHDTSFEEAIALTSPATMEALAFEPV